MQDASLKKNNNNNGLEDDLDRRIRSLDERLGKHRKKTGIKSADEIESEKPANVSTGAGFGNAMRLSSEFISAILVGAAIGYGIDWLIGTLPVAMIIFVLLGFVAGVLNVLRAAGELSGPLETDMKRQEKE